MRSRKAWAEMKSEAEMRPPVTVRAPGVAGGGHGVGRVAQQGLAFGAVAQLDGQGLACAVFGAFADRPDSLEPEREGGRLHVGSIGKWGLDLK